MLKIGLLHFQEVTFLKIKYAPHPVSLENRSETLPQTYAYMKRERSLIEFNLLIRITQIMYVSLFPNGNFGTCCLSLSSFRLLSGCS